MKKSKDLMELLSKKIEELRDSNELGTIADVAASNRKGENVFTEMRKSVEESDKENNGWTSGFLDWIVGQVEDRLGIDLEKGLIEHVENVNKETKAIEQDVKDVLKDSSVRSVFEQIADFAKKGPRSVFDSVLDKALKNTDLVPDAETKGVLEKMVRVIQNNDESAQQDVMDWVERKLKAQLPQN